MALKYLKKALFWEMPLGKKASSGRPLVPEEEISKEGGAGLSRLRKEVFRQEERRHPWAMGG